MKKIISFVLTILILCLSTVSAHNSDIAWMYSIYGGPTAVAKADVEYYRQMGWTENINDVTKILYAYDGREILVFMSEIDTYKNQGWFENKTDVTKTMYAPDGREILIYKSEIEAYKNVGWFENKSDVTKTMYAPDGREILIYKSEIEAYKNVGWFENKSEVTAVLASADGRKITVYKSEIASYAALGWTEIQNTLIDSGKPMVAITFDDGPRPASTGRILNALEFYNARATFFVIGNLAVNHTDILKRMQSLGCQIGNHTYSHSDLTTLSSYNISYQLNQTAEIINGAIGFYPTAVRPPYGSYNNTVMYTANKPLVLWSIDTLDWKSRNADSVTDIVLSQIRDGDIILMHDIYDSTATAAERIIPALISRGYQLVTVDELAQYKNKPMRAGNAYSKFR